MDPLSLAVLAASAFAKFAANEEAAERREAYRRRMEAYQRTKARDTERATEALVSKQTPEARGAELKDITVDREQSLRDTVGAAQAFDAPAIAGKLGSDYSAAQEATAGRIAERTRRAIEQLATMGAPQEQAEAFGRRFGRAASEVDANNRASRNVGEGYLKDIESVQPDPFLSLAADAGMAVGSSGLFEGGVDASVANNGQGWEDAAGNLYSDNVVRQLKAPAKLKAGVNRAFGLFGAS